MIPVYTQEEFDRAKTNDKLKCRCYNCNSVFLTFKKNIISFLEGKKDRCKFCNLQCVGENRKTNIIVTCKNCDKKFAKRLSQITKTKNNFCSKSCAVTYNNKHKTHGIRRSKLEVYIEEQLTKLYTGLYIDYNKKDAINSELDIYIPSLKLAFELNGIYHYEPIHGQDKLKQTQNNDDRKFQACLEKEIELVIIDSSSLSYFKKERADKFLNIIIEIINKKCTQRGT